MEEFNAPIRINLSTKQYMPGEISGVRVKPKITVKVLRGKFDQYIFSDMIKVARDAVETIDNLYNDAVSDSFLDIILKYDLRWSEFCFIIDVLSEVFNAIDTILSLEEHERYGGEELSLEHISDSKIEFVVNKIDNSENMRIPLYKKCERIFTSDKELVGLSFAKLAFDKIADEIVLWYMRLFECETDDEDNEEEKC